MSRAFWQYMKLTGQMMMARVDGLRETEDRIADEMDPVWWELTPEEMDLSREIGLLLAKHES